MKTMKKKIFVGILAGIMSTTTFAVACGPGDPNCFDISSDINIHGSQWQNMSSYFSETNNDYHLVNGGGYLSQGAYGYGEAQDGASGFLKMQQAEYGEYANTTTDNHGFETSIGGQGFGEMAIQGSVTPDCELEISGNNWMNGNTYIDHSANSMSAQQYTTVDAQVNLTGEDVSAYSGGGQIHGYNVTNGANWQSGFAETGHTISVNPQK